MSESGDTRPDGERAESGLDPATIAQWRHRIGADAPLGSDPTRYLHRAGAQGLANHMPTFRVSADPARGFEEYLYWRPLEELLSFSLLRTHCATDRPLDRVETYRSEFVIVGTQHLPGRGVIEQYGRVYRYDHPAHLVMVHNDQPFRQESYGTADLAGIWVPTDLLGRRARESWSMVPLVDSSPLARATAAFLRRFANDVAVRQAVIDVDAEYAVAEMVRAALAPHRRDVFGAADSALYVREITRSLIEQNYRDPEFGVDTIARLLHVSRRHMYRFFADAGDEQSPAALIARRRVMRARELLVRNSRMSLREVAAASGFVSTGTLTKRFRAEFGMAPSEYRKAVQAGEVAPPPVHPDDPADREIRAGEVIPGEDADA